MFSHCIFRVRYGVKICDTYPDKVQYYTWLFLLQRRYNFYHLPLGEDCRNFEFLSYSRYRTSLSIQSTSSIHPIDHRLKLAIEKLRMIDFTDIWIQLHLPNIFIVFQYSLPHISHEDLHHWLTFWLRCFAFNLFLHCLYLLPFKADLHVLPHFFAFSKELHLGQEFGYPRGYASLQP